MVTTRAGCVLGVVIGHQGGRGRTGRGRDRGSRGRAGTSPDAAAGEYSGSAVPSPSPPPASRTFHAGPDYGSDSRSDWRSVVRPHGRRVHPGPEGRIALRQSDVADHGTAGSLTSVLTPQREMAPPPASARAAATEAIISRSMRRGFHAETPVGRGRWIDASRNRGTKGQRGRRNYRARSLAHAPNPCRIRPSTTRHRALGRNPLPAGFGRRGPRGPGRDPGPAHPLRPSRQLRCRVRGRGEPGPHPGPR